MKKRIWILAGLVILAAGCVKIKNLTNINVNIPYSETINVPSDWDSVSHPFPPGGVTTDLPSVPVATNSDQYISDNNTASDKIISVTLKSLSITMLAPPDSNLNYIDTVWLYISAKSLPEVLVAQKGVPKHVSSVSLDPQGVNLKNYFLQDTMYVRMKARYNSMPPAGSEIKFSSNFNMLANPLN